MPNSFSDASFTATSYTLETVVVTGSGLGPGVKRRRMPPTLIQRPLDKSIVLPKVIEETIKINLFLTTISRYLFKFKISRTPTLLRFPKLFVQGRRMHKELIQNRLIAKHYTKVQLQIGNLNGIVTLVRVPEVIRLTVKGKAAHFSKFMHRLEAETLHGLYHIYKKAKELDK